MILLSFLIIPILICFFSWLFTDQITWKEIVLQMVIQIGIISLMSYYMMNENMTDVEIWNGTVTKKWTEKISCRHSYKCFCHNVCKEVCSSGKHRSCSTSCSEKCQTCHEHSYDLAWLVKDTLKEEWWISTVDRQGLQEPPRWSSVVLGEPTSSRHTYTNYIKGSPDSLFSKVDISDDLGNFPSYPESIKDYWKLDRFVQVDTSFPDASEWNKGISKISGDLGYHKQVNLILVLVNNKPHDYFYKLERFWVGGKKNDVILVIGVNEYKSILWADVMSLSNEEFKIYLRNDILAIHMLDRDKLLEAIERNIKKHYVRKPMKDFEYLKNSIKPTKGQMIFGFVFGIILSIGLSFFFYYQDPFRDEI